MVILFFSVCQLYAQRTINGYIWENGRAVKTATMTMSDDGIILFDSRSHKITKIETFDYNSHVKATRYICVDGQYGIIRIFDNYLNTMDNSFEMQIYYLIEDDGIVTKSGIVTFCKNRPFLAANTQSLFPDDGTPTITEMGCFERVADELYVHVKNIIIQIEYRNITRNNRTERIPIAIGFYENDKLYEFETLCQVWTIPALLATNYPNQEQRSFLKAYLDVGCNLAISLNKNLFLIR